LVYFRFQELAERLGRSNGIGIGVAPDQRQYTSFLSDDLDQRIHLLNGMNASVHLPELISIDGLMALEDERRELASQESSRVRCEDEDLSLGILSREIREGALKSRLHMIGNNDDIFHSEFDSEILEALSDGVYRADGNMAFLAKF
jgi:hypothetical protein